MRYNMSHAGMKLDTSEKLALARIMWRMNLTISEIIADETREDVIEVLQKAREELGETPSQTETRERFAAWRSDNG